ncbi:MAG TPA: 4Fe-4S dicluster domain-containing protein [Acidimicrobiales bacterium]|nr:4Fe-4S dicluster domain-containing protein [Acidimicrobiales bacterium]
MKAGDEVVVDRAGLDRLVDALHARGMRTVGPVVRDGAILHDELTSPADMPEGWHDTQAPGAYRIVHHDDDPRLFAWAVGPTSLKAQAFPPRAVVWRTTGSTPQPTEPRPLAVVGARPCELAGLAVLDAVLAGGRVPDPDYAGRRAGTFVVAADCGFPSGSCFCVSMGTGPDAGAGYDLALTELSDDDGHRFLLRVGTERGAAVAEGLGGRPVTAVDRAARDTLLDRARASMGRSLDTEDLPALLAATLEHPRWDDVAERCLACGNCTMVCPTCFCSTVEDVSDLDGSLERTRRWASCFEERHSYLHGGAVRATTRSRYRQWLTHKLGTWHDQFGMSGCVGCGRCITWCPVGIDITEEVAAIRADARPARAQTGSEER